MNNFKLSNLQALKSGTNPRYEPLRENTASDNVTDELLDVEKVALVPRRPIPLLASRRARLATIALLILLVPLLPLLARALPSPPRSQPLRFNPDRTFQICIFEDLHFGEAEDTLWGPAQDANTTRIMNSILDAESPDLVVLNGDLITGENTFLANSTDYVDRIVAPMVQRGLSWASAYGNHDSQFNLSREAVLARERRYSNSMTKQMAKGKEAGVSNYYLPVFGADENSNDGDAAPEMLLWFFDSRGGSLFQQLDSKGSPVAQPDWVEESVVQWFNETKAALRQRYGNVRIPSLAFVHIPVGAMLAFQNSGVDAHKQPGINADVPVAQQGAGWAEGGHGEYTGQDVPFMAALLDTPGLLGVFSGHDHGDDWCARWEGRLPGMDERLVGNGLNLCFGRHTGYGGYGRWMRGARQVVVDLEGWKEQGFETWVRMEEGSVTGRVMLNGTFGRDEYEEVPVRYTP